MGNIDALVLEAAELDDLIATMRNHLFQNGYMEDRTGGDLPGRTIFSLDGNGDEALMIDEGRETGVASERLGGAMKEAGVARMVLFTVYQEALRTRKMLARVLPRLVEGRPICENTGFFDDQSTTYVFAAKAIKRLLFLVEEN